jgi:hypothetical protein
MPGLTHLDIKFVMKLRSFLLCFWALLPDE